jgi:hypothetical protein
MSSIGETNEFNNKSDLSQRKGESITDLPDWDNEIMEWDSATGIYYVAGKPVSMCQGVAMYKEEETDDKDKE